MKVLGISFGKKMGNTDILVKQALYGAGQQGAEVEFVNTVNMNIGRCIGCGVCSRSFEQGKDNDCIVVDDLQPLEEKIRNADAVVLGAPVYVLQPVGQFKDVVDRYSCRHDQAKIVKEAGRRERGESQGEPIDPRRTKQQYVAYISVGGASTHNWVSMGLPTLHLFGFPRLMHVVGEIDAYNMGNTASPVLDEALMARAGELGSRVADAIGKSPEDVEWFGEPGTCPACHQNLISLNGTATVECPVCGIEGHLKMEGERVWVEFSPEQQARARSTMAGLVEHDVEIAGFGGVAGPKLQAAKDRLPGLLEPFRNFEKYTAKG